MAAKVIDDQVATWVRVCQCSDCKSKVEIHVDDITWCSLGSFDEFKTYHGFTCPACSTWVTVNALPGWVKRRAKKHEGV